MQSFLVNIGAKKISQFSFIRIAYLQLKRQNLKIINQETWTVLPELKC